MFVCSLWMIQLLVSPLTQHITLIHDTNSILLPFHLSAPGDYFPVDRTLTFTATMASFDIDISISADSIDELDKTFTANLMQITTRINVFIDPDEAIITILDDDGTFLFLY